MDNAELWIAAGLGVIGLLLGYVLWPGRGTSAGKSYGPDTAMGFGMSDVGRGDSGTGAGIDAGGAGGDGGSS